MGKLGIQGVQGEGLRLPGADQVEGGNSENTIVLKDLIEDLELEDHKEKAAAWRPKLGAE